MNLIHRLFNGHWPKWYAKGYDFIEVWWACSVCEVGVAGLTEEES